MTSQGKQEIIIVVCLFESGCGVFIVVLSDCGCHRGVFLPVCLLQNLLKKTSLTTSLFLVSLLTSPVLSELRLDTLDVSRLFKLKQISAENVCKYSPHHIMLTVLNESILSFTGE